MSRLTLIDSGDYVGKVVYTERSRIAIEVIDDVPKAIGLIKTEKIKNTVEKRTML